jgi:hypothetical protein
MLTKEIHKEITTAKQTISNAEKRISELKDNLLINLLYERNNQALPYSYENLFNEIKTLREDVENAPQTLSDKAASFVPSMFPVLEGNGTLVKAGTRVYFNNKLFRTTVDLWDTENYNPLNTPTLWEEVSYIKGIRVIPEVISVTSAFSKGEQGYWSGKIYESLIDANVWTPVQYPTGWQVKE